jgi:hypothetical protein
MKLTNPTGRKTDARVLTFGQHAFYFSYEMCIGYSGPLGNVRRENVWAQTTGRHINEMGLRNFPVDESGLQNRIATFSSVSTAALT